MKHSQSQCTCDDAMYRNQAGRQVIFRLPSAIYHVVVNGDGARHRGYLYLLLRLYGVSYSRCCVVFRSIEKRLRSIKKTKTRSLAA
jgi:hypothetical protein